jgi:maltose O-acetyltransferase
MSEPDTEMTERERMLSGARYRASDPELVAQRRQARRLTSAFNATGVDDEAERAEILKKLFGKVGPRVEIEPPFRCDYGTNILAEDGLYINFGCIILDCSWVRIGRDVFIGPNVQIITAGHPLDPDERCGGEEYAESVTIGDRVWIGAGAIVCPGVTIGDEAVIGAGSVVVSDVPPRVVAVGNPCRVVRTID